MTTTVMGILLIVMFIPSGLALSFPLASQPDSSYQTGVQVIFTSNFTSTTEVIYSIPYTSVMNTSSLNASLAIYGIGYYTVSTAFGWKLYVGSVTASNVMVHLAVFATGSPIRYLRVCYLISSRPSL